MHKWLVLPLMLVCVAAVALGADAGAPQKRRPPPTQTSTTTVTTPAPTPPASNSSYPIHSNITAVIFWIGEPVGGGSTEDNAVSAYDDAWQAHYGGYDNFKVVRAPPTYANGLGFVPKQNPFYLDLPYDDINKAANFKARGTVIPWATEFGAAAIKNQNISLMKNQWVKLWHVDKGVTYTAYGQVEDAGPYKYDDAAYVFGTNDTRPASKQANNAGLDVSPALRDALHFTGTSLADQQNGSSNKVSWQFVRRSEVPPGPWLTTPTTMQVYQP